MLSMLLAILASAFPVRGNRLVAVDSNLALGSDTLHIYGGCSLGACASCTYSFKELSRTGAVSVFPGSLVTSTPFAIMVDWSTQAGSWSPSTTCYARVTPRDKLPFKTIYRGTRTWALQADTILYRIEQSPRAYLIVAEPVLVRWSWAPYDSTRPLVRWLDTIRLSPDDSTPRGTPVLTLRDSLRIDSIAPVLPSSRIRALELIFDVRIGTVAQAQILWSTMTGTPVSVPNRKLPPGTDIRFRSGVSDKRGSDILWRVWSGGKAVDSFVVHTPTTVEIENRRHRPALRPPSGNHDALGRNRDTKFRQLDFLFAP